MRIDLHGYRPSEIVWNGLLIKIVQQGRTTEQKQATYRALAERLHDECGLGGHDLIVSVVENSPVDWSFGGGTAQFVTGDL